ncbi:MKRN2 opposite strand protein isoform X2 [Pelodiscus sinensis]|uniref:MKRN2 opposite strand n=1 Tax=Pelodiscus sinensis TaxID=13735 RepID=K7FUU3_PELSI|nr:MKRN2 opposite strand protein isoform X2 [Pelodiscus sinensis]|eukprot:XP_006117689.1 MKRN2 opposite strand protein isoform X2 [Pelodiscus sinensis]
MHLSAFLALLSTDIGRNVHFYLHLLQEHFLGPILKKLMSEYSSGSVNLFFHFSGGYNGSSDLHVGITNTNGLVYNYNETGVHRVEHGWEQCISILLVQPDMYGLLNQWDKYLEEFSTGEAWFFHRYDEHHHNCYTYALTFINCVLAAQGKQPTSKSEFTERFVIPQTRKASKYITLYQEVAENYFYISDSPDQEKNNSEEDKLLP